ncbi:DinB family protein [Lentzea sp. NBC_00516]|uniref:DinB family protein n=1 Tax=Lentzea sp. NBC_00516 TaxID=2903582 RepID=UPI002E823D7F|nr:DinB family protein [Lentzea sp. NBC_00516]WUD23765.1 DinB family protein [Lentzea sp. NBC_00516]
MTVIDEQGRPEPPMGGNELDTLKGFLEFHRATLMWKIEGLTAEQLNATAAKSPMTLGGMVKHLAYVEEQWFRVVLHDREPLEPWASVDWKADNDWDWRSAANDTPEQLRELWRRAVDGARKDLVEALRRGDLSQPAKRAPWRDGRVPSLRWILTHMIEEYSRHNGHADLIREAIDGQTGE